MTKFLVTTESFTKAELLVETDTEDNARRISTHGEYTYVDDGDGYEKDVQIGIILDRASSNRSKTTVTEVTTKEAVPVTKPSE